MEINFRPAALDDCLYFLEIRNDPQTRANSFNTEEISLEVHTKWFQATLKNPKRNLYVLLNDSNKIGVIRFDRDDKTPHVSATINISIAKESRGKGLGTLAIQTLSKFYLNAFGLEYIIAEIKPENIASIKSFEKAGYVFQSSFPEKLVFTYSK